MTQQHKRRDATGGTEEHPAVDASIREKFGNTQAALEEGFGASHGLRGQSKTSGGKVKHPEARDRTTPDRVPKTIEEENPGLADN